MEAQLVALYLMTSPHANMIGVFHLPVMYLAHETGLTIPAATAALQRLADKDFCTYEAESEWIFVHRFAANQIGEELKEGDKRIKGVLNEIAKVPDGICLAAFTKRYSTPFHLGISPSEAPSKPLRSQNRTEQKQKQEQNPSEGFVRFWDAWPKHERKESKGECLKAWGKAKAEEIADVVIADVERRKRSSGWTKNGGEFIPAPLVYLNQRKWEGADAVNDDPFGIKKAVNYVG